ncbi:protein of unknown function [Streptomyces sp. KY75]|nr:protein of unknown function [Streptomyces sp. KY70]CAD5987847.1 protein of unknown function [Streptomyces sp. KY75]
MRRESPVPRHSTPTLGQKISINSGLPSEIAADCNRVTEQASAGRVSRGLRRRFGHAHSRAFGMHGNP